VKPIEEMHQRSLIQWASWATAGGLKVGDYLFHIPNGGHRDPRTAAKLKGQGVKAGVSDLFLPVPRGTMHGLWIELKAPATAGNKPGKPTREQIEWLDRMGGMGYAAVICWGWLHAKETITEYLEVQ
jgi:hypothetical protein